MKADILQFFFGVIDIVRTQLWGEGGSAKCVQMRARGEGGIGFEYARILALKRPPICGCFNGRFTSRLQSDHYKNINLVTFCLESAPLHKFKKISPVAVGSPGHAGKFLNFFNLTCTGF